MKQILKSALARAGLELARTADRQSAALADLMPADRELIARVEPFTMTSLDRRASLLGAIDHVVRHRIAGDIVECGVWRGGSMMLAALALMARGDTSRDLWLYDTFEGMSEPGAEDRARAAKRPRRSFARTPRGGRVVRGRPERRARQPRIDRLPRERIHFVEGKVEDTIPATLPAWCCSGWIPTGTSRRGTSSATSIRCCRATASGDRRLRPLEVRARRSTSTCRAGEPIYLHRVDYTARFVATA
jgi:hypothetical protein